ncbi:hypothetical protein Lepto7375DRAFT_2213 [Leptolyngbya sp. PCC 7375]|nr:hypothetical protein Lepto7375DRAFT_2213 [Leptolyngbya sp. PCC 7375]
MVDHSYDQSSPLETSAASKLKIGIDSVSHKS